jgi:type VI protein secretion system component VasK
MSNPQADLQLIRMLSERLERISADSIWAHRASGVRGSLLRMLEQLQSGDQPDTKSLTNIISIAFNILSHAAKRS